MTGKGGPGTARLKACPDTNLSASVADRGLRSLRMTGEEEPGSARLKACPDTNLARVLVNPFAGAAGRGIETPSWSREGSFAFDLPGLVETE